MTKSKKIVSIVLAALVAVSAVAGVLVYVFKNYDDDSFTTLTTPVSSENYVDFKNGVHIAEDTSEIQDDYEELKVENGQYTLFYDEDIPEFFENMKTGEIFCVYPDSGSSEPFFELGFCGKLTGISRGEETSSVSFTMPALTDVFKDISINTKGSAVSSTAFYPSENVTRVSTAQNKLSTITSAAARPNTLATAAGISPFLNVDKLGFSFEEPKTESLLDDYALVCNELELEFDFAIEDDDGQSVGAEGKITLEDMAVKAILDYHYDAAKKENAITDFDFGFMAKHKVELEFSAEKSIGLDDLRFDLSEDLPGIEIEDVTASEDGKIVLGTYLIGLEASLPILQKYIENDKNRVSYLSLGIAVQFALTGNGKLSMEYSMEESGFIQREINKQGKTVVLDKCYSYPNPATESREPTEDELNSVPEVTSEMKGEASFNLAVGGDIGICILGMIPVKQVNNFLEVDITNTFVMGDNDKAVEVISNNYIMDDNVDSLMISTNSNLKLHLGVKVNFPGFKYTVGELGGGFQFYKKVLVQTPPPVGFSHSECGFGGVFVGETYSDEELDEAFSTYMDKTDTGSLITSVKDLTVGSLADLALNELNLDIFDISEIIGENCDGHKFDFYASGVIYVRDEANKVVAAIVMGDSVTNKTGIHNGLSIKKIEQVYSAPDMSTEININIGFILRWLFDFGDLENTELVGKEYRSSDSKEKMELLFCDDTLKMIVIS